jgi:hypothetical protein
VETNCREYQLHSLLGELLSNFGETMLSNPGSPIDGDHPARPRTIQTNRYFISTSFAAA